MKRHKSAVLFLLVFLICVVVIFAFTISELSWRFEMLGMILKKQLSQPPMPPPSEIFRQHILDPIPESVTNIRADRPKNFLGSYTYTLRFNINRADLALLINSRPLVKVWNVEYRDGDLFWAWDTWRGFSMNACTIIVYDSRRWRRKPKWFRPELWDNPEAYAFRKVGDRVNIQSLKYDKKTYDRINEQVLLYNEKEGEAYFIVSSLK